MPWDSEETERNMRRYKAACHAVQTGVAWKMVRDPKDTESKHLRTGINVALTDNSSLAKLLVTKGVITEEEFAKALADGMEEEVARYEALIDPTGRVHLV